MIDVAEHYERTSTIAPRNRAMAMRYGFWRPGVWTYPSAQNEENLELAYLGGLSVGDKIIDIGCGFGGSVVWLAKNYKTCVTGIAVSEKEISIARAYAKRRSISDSTFFIVGTGEHTGIADSSFDIVWMIESVSAIYDKATLLEEAYRLLRPGGKIIVADLFLSREVIGWGESKLMNVIEIGFAATPIMKEQVKDLLMQSHFSEIQLFEKTRSIVPSILLYGVGGVLASPLIIPLLLFPSLRLYAYNILASILQTYAFGIGFFSYNVFIATKLDSATLEN